MGRSPGTGQTGANVIWQERVNKGMNEASLHLATHPKHSECKFPLSQTRFVLLSHTLVYRCDSYFYRRLIPRDSLRHAHPSCIFLAFLVPGSGGCQHPLASAELVLQKVGACAHGAHGVGSAFSALLHSYFQGVNELRPEVFA